MLLIQLRPLHRQAAMDPITGIGLAASIVQLVMCGLDAVHKCKELYRQGSINEFSSVDCTTRHLASLTESLQQSLKTSSAQSQALTNKERNLIELARKCEDCARRLLKELQNLQTKPRASALEAVRKAALALLKGPSIRKIQGEMEGFRSLLESSLLHRLR